MIRISDDRIRAGSGCAVIEHAVECPLDPIARVVVTLGDGNDAFDAGDYALPMRIDGGAGDDELRGGGGDDQLTGGPGRDRLLGLDGNDTLHLVDGTADHCSAAAPNAPPGVDRVDADTKDAESARLSACFGRSDTPLRVVSRWPTAASASAPTVA
jgi:hypothetical protein